MSITMYMIVHVHLVSDPSANYHNMSCISCPTLDRPNMLKISHIAINGCSNYYIIIIYSYLSRDIPTDLSVFLQGALTKYIIECVDHEVMWHCEYQEEQSST